MTITQKCQKIKRKKNNVLESVRKLFGAGDKR